MRRRGICRGFSPDDDICLDALADRLSSTRSCSREILGDHWSLRLPRSQPDVVTCAKRSAAAGGVIVKRVAAPPLPDRCRAAPPSGPTVRPLRQDHLGGLVDEYLQL